MILVALRDTDGGDPGIDRNFGLNLIVSLRPCCLMSVTLTLAVPPTATVTIGGCAVIVKSGPRTCTLNVTAWLIGPLVATRLTV